MWVGTVNNLPQAIFPTKALATAWKAARLKDSARGSIEIHDVPILTYDTPFIGKLDDPTVEQIASEYVVLHGIATRAEKDAAQCMLVGTEAKGKLKGYADRLINEYDQDGKPRAYRVSQDRLLIVKRNTVGTPDITIVEITK